MSKSSEKTGKEKASNPPTRKPTYGESLRETVDSIVIAFILAFMFRTFEAEAFVIPTGSMALTLMGAHKDFECPQCGTAYRVGASSENPDDGDQPVLVTSSVCPNCRYHDRYQEPFPPTFNGDRILVTKYSYDFHEPERYDVAVFKNPSHAKQNYIKRVIGLPGEEVLIWHGDIYVRKSPEEKFRIARKPADKALTVMQTVYDNDHVLPTLIERGWPHRWTAEPHDGAPTWLTPYDERLRSGGDARLSADDLKTFRTDGKAPDEAWLRYQHVVPGELAWQRLSGGPLDPADKIRLARPQLITDFCEYNSGRSREPNDVTFLGLHWVGDLALECELEFLERHADDAQAVLELVEGGRAFQCRIDAATGDAVLSISGRDEFRPRAKGAVAGKGPHRLRFANVDDQLLLWVDDRPVEFDAPTTFQSFEEAPVYEIVEGEGRFRVTNVPLGGDDGAPAPLGNVVPTTQDKDSPAGIAARGVGLSVGRLRILRDVYYIADKRRTHQQFAWTPAGNQPGNVCDYRDDVFAPFRNAGLSRPQGFAGPEEVLRAFMSDVATAPQRWTSLAAVSFPLEKDQFFVLGDNSAQSLDGRLWDSHEHFVKRELLIGKALFVYWPHALPTIPGTNVPFPFFPNFGRMRLIR